MTELTNNATPAKNDMAIPALVLGIIGAVLPFTVLLPLSALIFGLLGILKAQKIKDQTGKALGLGLSIAGLVIGAVYTLFGFFLALTWLLSF